MAPTLLTAAAGFAAVASSNAFLPPGILGRASAKSPFRRAGHEGTQASCCAKGGDGSVRTADRRPRALAVGGGALGHLIVA